MIFFISVSQYVPLAGSVVRAQIPIPNTNTNPNQVGDYVSFYLEYEYESELGRVSYCVYTYLYTYVSHLVVLVLHHSGGEVNVM